MAVVKVVRKEARSPRPLDHVRGGLTALKMRNADRAAEELRRAASLDPNLDSAHFYLGLAYIELTELERAAEELEEALRLSTDFASGRKYLNYARERKTQ